MKSLIKSLIPIVVAAAALSGCATKATYDVSNADDLRNFTVVDLRENGNPAGQIASFDPRRSYFSENALGPSLISIFKSRLANHDSSVSAPTTISIRGIEISALPVDNSMSGNANDPGATYQVAPIFIPTVGVFPLITGPSSNKSLVSVRTIIRYEVAREPKEVTEYGMSTKGNMEPEIKKVFHRAVDRLAEQL